MPRPALRTRRSQRRVKVTTPSGQKVTHYVKKAPGPARCASCRKPLHGIARRSPIRLAGTDRIHRRVNRPYGGNLCSPCMRTLIKAQLR